MEPETCTAAQGEDSEKDENVRESPPTTGEKSDEGQQIISERNIYWYRTTLALDYLQPAFLLIVKDEMKSLQEEIKMYFERKLCLEATAKDIELVNKTRAEFRHICTAKPYECQTLIYLILQHTDGYVQSYEMVKGTDPQKWLTSPFEFVRLFLEDWMRRDIHDFPDCDVTALCGLVNSCMPLKKMFAPTNIDKVRTVRNRTMHKARLNIDQQEMQKYIGEILDFLQHIKTLPTKALRNTDEITKAIDIIEKLRIGDVRILPGIVVQLIQGWLSSARRQFAHENDVVDNLRQNIAYMENELARLTSGQEVATTIKKAEEMKFQAKIEKLTDENLALKQQTEDMAKVIEELNKRLETMESRSVGEVCRPKAIPTQRSPDKIGQPEYMTADFSIPGDGDGQEDTEEKERLENEEKERKEKERLEKEEKERKEKERLENEEKERKEKAEKEKEEIQQKIRQLEWEIRKEEEEIKDLKEAISDLEAGIDFLQERSSRRRLLGVAAVGATILTGGLFGAVGAASGAAVGTALFESLSPSSKRHVRDVDMSTEEGCRKGIRDLEVDIKRRNNRIDAIRIEIRKLDSELLLKSLFPNLSDE